MGLYSRLSFLVKYPKAVNATLFGVVFALLLIGAAAIGSIQILKGLDKQMDRDLRSLNVIGDNIGRTVAKLEIPSTMVPCSSAFQSWLERIGFLPDGIHEIIYDDGTVSCSVTEGLRHAGLKLGEPDIIDQANGYQLWLDRDLQMLGQNGLTGTFFRKNSFTLVLPRIDLEEALTTWHEREMLSPIKDGSMRHRAGKFGLSHGLELTALPDSGFSLEKASFWSYKCNSNDLICIYSVAPIADTLFSSRGALVLVVAILGVVAFMLAKLLSRRVMRIWSFQSRFIRTMSYETLECFYQPLLSLDTGEIEGVEALVRWRDTDGSLVFPDRFLPIVEKKRLTKQLTACVIARAIDDLRTIEFSVEVPRVNINIFPQDFEGIWLIKALLPMIEAPRKLQPVVEIVETANLPLEETKEAVSLLRASGIETYIDDFGVGYSSIHYLSALGADGVKLDRSFAMAPEGSLNKTMLFSAIEMISKTGLKLVVEGVEDRDRLMELRATNKVDIIQGYLISPPMSPKRLRTFLADFQIERLQNVTHTTHVHPDIKAVFKK
ncbi:sensor c-di-GMP phosphodiesterase, contains CSS-motif sensor and EAL domain [Cohaesibacter sp. ES.047]|uniref:EAL domain-containing protein n=1 Tax=Cohaesibacter sp. ES.047 TaxID=1798205 RepID=UPI000BB786AA|nr:EAL domain-containing protein [Cohaesibacter sp. ES.047]SNY92100.1 sensor c-di-GMP phosphodiesterase, contains CSS-motif sensor and EAL domain [Cohaesibacter sp. ES.047]